MFQYECSIVVFEAFVYVSFLRFFIKREIKVRWLVLVYAIFMVGMLAYRLLDDNTPLFFILSIGSIVAFTMIYGVRLKTSLFLGAAVSIASLAARELSYYFVEMTYNQSYNEVGKDGDLYIIGSLVAKLILLVILRIIIRIFVEHDRKLTIYQWLATMSVPIISIYTAHKIISVAHHFHDSDCIYSFVFLTGVSAINMVAFILYDGMAKRAEALVKQEQENTRLEAENNRYNKMISYANDVCSFMHDVQSHMKTIVLLTESNKHDEAADYIRKLDIKVTDMYEQSILSQYPAVDTVLRQKTVEARIRGITLLCDITVPANMPIDPIDLCIILGNALDNAIEACSQIKGETTITLKMFLTRNRLSITITNPSMPVMVIENKCETTKADKDLHGYGMKNIENTIHKYKGNMVVEYENGYFCMIVLILFND